MKDEDEEGIQKAYQSENYFDRGVNHSLEISWNPRGNPYKKSEISYASARNPFEKSRTLEVCWSDLPLDPKSIPVENYLAERRNSTQMELKVNCVFFLLSHDL